MIAEFCSWCREYVVKKNLDCKECEDCLKCQHFDKGCCTNETVVSEYRKEWNRPAYVLGIGPPLCRKYCPYLSEAERRRAFLLSEGENAYKKNSGIKGTNVENEKGEKDRTILFTPLPKFWLNDDCECITFEVDFNETIYYHMTILGWCEWEIPEEINVEII
ncbi:MAG: hypothetical protein QXK98_04495 [Candidatus Bathyarchaeia archaeon]